MRQIWHVRTQRVKYPHFLLTDNFEDSMRFYVCEIWSCVKSMRSKSVNFDQRDFFLYVNKNNMIVGCKSLFLEGCTIQCDILSNVRSHESKNGRRGWIQHTLVASNIRRDRRCSSSGLGHAGRRNQDQVAGNYFKSNKSSVLNLHYSIK